MGIRFSLSVSKRVCIRVVSTALVLAAMLLVGSCARGMVTNGRELEDSSVDIAGILIELEALEPLEGVEPDLFDQLKEELSRQLKASGNKVACTPSAYPINDFEELIPTTDPPTYTWSSDNFIADGSLDGLVGIEDITPIATYYGMQWTDDTGEDYEPYAKLGDYDRDGSVGIADITPLAQTFGQDVAGYIIEWVEDYNLNGKPDEPYEAWTYGGALLYEGNLGEENRNVNGFNVWEFQFAEGYLPKVEHIWVRVVPYDVDDFFGLPSQSVLYDQGPPPENWPIVTDMLIQITGTTNTDIGSDYLGSDLYYATHGGVSTTGEAAANSDILIILFDIAFMYGGTPYPFGTRDDLPIGDINEELFDGIIDDLDCHMDYTMESAEIPPDVEAWEEDETQPREGYAGRLGPNEPGTLRITVAELDSALTLGYDIQVTIELTLIEDVDAPEVWGFSPLEQLQSATEIHTIQLDWGEDEIGDEFPLQVALYDAESWTVAYTFTPATVVETEEPPENEGEYTLRRIPDALTYTTVIQAKVAGMVLAEGGNYAWRISEDDSGFERRSSLKKPGDVLSIIGSE